MEPTESALPRARPLPLRLDLSLLALAFLAGTCLVGELEPRPGEGAPLRWVRACLAHPWRTGLAVVLAWSAMGARRNAPSQRWEKEL